MTEESNSVTNSETVGQELDRVTLLRDMVVLQVKLLVDGLRDFILVPVSLVAGITSLCQGGDARRSNFYKLLRIGRRSDHWINLFGAAEPVYGPSFAEERFMADDIDEIVNRVESVIVEEYHKGGVPQDAKDQLDRAFSYLHKMTSRIRNTDKQSD